MNPAKNIEKHRREGLRADLLLTLNVSAPYGASETLILRTLGDTYEDVGPAELRRELSYLEDKGLATIDGRKTEIWKAAITPEGRDVVEGAKDVPAGIAPMR